MKRELDLPDDAWHAFDRLAEIHGDHGLALRLLLAAFTHAGGTFDGRGLEPLLALQDDPVVYGDGSGLTLRRSEIVRQFNEWKPPPPQREGE